MCAEAAALLGTAAEGPTATDLTARSTETFKALGFDSSMAVELRNRLNAAASVRLPATVAFSCPTPHRLALHLFSLLEPQEPKAPDTGRKRAWKAAATTISTP
ncbi:acyl carrier protein [Streptomyces lasalocidi]